MKKKTIVIIGVILVVLLGIGVFQYIKEQRRTYPTGYIERWPDSLNSVIITYEGRQKGVSVKDLITQVISLNTKNRDTHNEKIVYINNIQDETTLTELKKSIVSGKTYNVELETNESGWITKITVTEVTE